MWTESGTEWQPVFLKSTVSTPLDFHGLDNITILSISKAGSRKGDGTLL